MVDPHGSLRLDRLSRRQQSPSAWNGADTAGWRLNAIAARPAPAMPLDAIRRPRDTPIWKLEGSFLEAGRIVPVPLLRNATLQAARAHDQADRNTPDHAFLVGASGPGAMTRETSSDWLTLTRQ